LFQKSNPKHKEKSARKTPETKATYYCGWLLIN